MPRPRSVQWDFTGLVELGRPHHQHAVVPVHVGTLEINGLTYPHAADGQEPDHGLEGRRSKRRGDEPGHLGHQGLDVAS